MNDTQYYVDQNGHQYYLDENDQPVYIDSMQPIQPAQVPQPQPEAIPAYEDSLAAQAAIPSEVQVEQQYAPPEDYDNTPAPLQAHEDMAGSAGQYAGEQVAVKSSKLPLVLTLVGAIGAGGGGAYYYSNMMGGSQTVQNGVPTIRASSSDTKVKPQNAGGKVIQNRNKFIYDRIGENNKPASEQLRNGAEEPIKSVASKARQAGPETHETSQSRWRAEICYDLCCDARWQGYQARNANSTQNQDNAPKN